ncbi:MAG TPA: tRNA (guanosine(37)-N1)-methyltransferase TrmD [Tenericutes bacterium]|nr:tRNA (guanosine(37)-N1)-methyltransferase TrmD [Mycoplasmatota bacterium]
MKIDILTLFPEMFTGILNTSIIKRAIKEGLVEVNVINFRKYSNDKHGKVDDTPYGGGPGMILMCEPIYNAIEALKTPDTTVIMMTPQGVPYKQKLAEKLKDLKHIILLCGHYEGFDERIREIVDLEISLGDFVLTGGEIPAMAIIDSIVRLIPGVIERDSALYDSFSNSLLEYPQNTRPAEFRGMKVPEVLLSGHHENIKKWREAQALERTRKRRPDLYEEAMRKIKK